jgi:predicted nucleic acid-binding protein
VKVVFDSNIVIDALEPRPPFDTAAKKLLRDVLERKISGFVTANCLTDIFYVLSRKAGVAKTKTVIANIAELLEILPVTAIECKKALALPMDDFEDALVAVCAKEIMADYIVTRDESFIKAGSPVALITPDELLKNH